MVAYVGTLHVKFMYPEKQNRIIFHRSWFILLTLYNDTNVWRWSIWGWRITRSYTLSIVQYRAIRWRSNIALEKSWNSLSHCTMHHNMASTTATMPMMSSSVPGAMWSNTYSHRSSFYRWVPLMFWKCRMPQNTEDYKNHQKHCKLLPPQQMCKEDVHFVILVHSRKVFLKLMLLLFEQTSILLWNKQKQYSLGLWQH